MNTPELQQRLPLSYSHADLGIGNASNGNPDWTFAGNAGEYKSKRLRILVHCVNEAGR